jgi:hypothetical protein
MLDKVVKFVVDHKEQFIRGVLVIGGGLIGIVSTVIAVKSNEDLPEEVVEAIAENPITEDPSV